jgi:hypothetical protein
VVGIQISAEQCVPGIYVRRIQFKHTNRVAPAVDGFAHCQEEESVRLTGSLLRAFAVHGVLNVVPEFLDVAGEPLHVCNLLHVNNYRLSPEPFIWSDSA